MIEKLSMSTPGNTANCGHNHLSVYDDYTGMVVKIENNVKSSKVEGMFTYKKYKCNICGKIITVLNAVVEKI